MNNAASRWPDELRPGRGVKFQVVDSATGKRSATWRVGTSRNHDDVYLMELETGPLWKVSHHNEGGVWRIAMTKDGAERLKLERQVIAHWEPRAPVDGWSEGVGVLISGKHLGDTTADRRPGVVVVPPPPPSHDAILVRLFFAEPHASPSRFKHGFPIGALRRAGGGLVYVLAEPQMLTLSAREELEHMRHEAAKVTPHEGYPNNRFVAVFAQGDGRFMADLCL